jgi:glycerophosphoryl diester phosphodiesterase
VNLPEALFAAPFAHRGLWREDGPAENSLAAIAEACADGYGVEFDVRLTADGEVVVFHDPTFERMCGVKGWVAETTLDEIRRLKLKGGPDGIPTLEEVLHEIAGRTLPLIELKTESGAEGPLEERVASLLDRYHHPFAVIGFSAQSHAWFAQHRPKFPRGLDAEGLSDQSLAETTLDLAYLFDGQVQLAQPDFLLLDFASAAGAIGRRYRAEGLPVICWTARSLEQVAAHDGVFDNFIFEGFTA